MKRWLPWIYALLVLLTILGLAATARAQTPPDHYDIVLKFVDKYGLPSNVNEDERREWIRRVAETLAARYPAEGWGNKARSESAAISGDILATRSPFWAVDVLTGTPSDPKARLNGWTPVDPATLGGQAWIPVTAHDWLATEPPPTPPEPPVTPPSEDTLAGILARLDGRLAALEAAVQAIPPPPPCNVTLPPVTFPVYEGAGRLRIPFLNVDAPWALTLKPKVQ